MPFRCRLILSVSFSAFQPKRSDRVKQGRASGIGESGKAEAEQAFSASPELCAMNKVPGRRIWPL